MDDRDYQIEQPVERHRRSSRNTEPQNDPESSWKPQQPQSEWQRPETQGEWIENRPQQVSETPDFYTAQPAQMNYMPEENTGNGGNGGKKPILPKILAVIAVIAVALALIFLLGGKAGGKKEPEKAAVIEVKTNETSVTVNNWLLFHLTTNKTAEDVRLEDEYGTQIACTRELSEETESTRFWLLKAIFNEPYSGGIYVAVRQNDVWTRTDQFVPLNVTEPVVTPAPTEVPTPVPTEVPTAVPTQIPTPAPTEEILPPEEGSVPDEGAVIEEEPAEMTEMPTVVAALPTWAPANATEVPTEAPTEVPTAAPTEEPTPVPTEEPTPAPTAAPRLIAQSTDKTAPSMMKISEGLYQGAKLQEGFFRKRGYIAPDPDRYCFYNAGVLTFRGDNFRRNAAFGTAEVEEGKMEVLWTSPIGSLRTEDDGTLYGVGWTGQPAIIKWPSEVRDMMDLNEEKKQVSALREVIFGAQDGKIYFLDLTDGQPTRDPITVGFPLKGSVAVDTYGRPILAVGQGISKLPNKTGTIGMHVFNLIDSKELFLINGRSSKTQKQYGTNGACDGTPLFLYEDDAMIFASENGLLYTVDLHPEFSYPDEENPDKKPGLSVSETVQYLYTKSGSEEKSQVAAETSVAMYDRYIYMADMYGVLRCVNSDDMTTVWAADMGDNTDAAIALDMTEDGVALYTGNTVYARLKSKKTCTIRRLDALSGEEVWAYQVGCDYDKSQQSGCKASPVIGQNGLDGTVYFTVNKVTGAGSRVIALDKETGREVWTFDMASTGTISSPVAVYNAEGRGWIIQADGEGTLHMLDGLTGREISSLALNGKVQGSPAVYKDILVIGTCDKSNSNMYGICIR